MNRLHHTVAALVLLTLCADPSASFAQTGENVALVINDASPASQRIGEHYKRSRAIPDSNIIHIKTTTDETIQRPQYVTDIESPIAAAIRRHSLQDRILYVVLTKGVPLRIAGTEGQEGTVASVDSELTLLYRRMTGRDAPIRGRVSNPYYLGAEDIRTGTPFTHRTQDIYLVTRLDAFTVDEAIALIDRARAPAKDGRFVFDQRAGLFSNPIGDRWLAEAHSRLTTLGLGDRVVLESTTNPAREMSDVLGYYSWGSNDTANRVRVTGMRFAPGALAATFVSSDARTFQEPPATWQPTSDWNDKNTWFAGSPQSLIGDLIREGATGVAGHVAEPYLQSTIRPEVLFPAYVSGFNLAEAFYMAMPDLSWQTVVVGDPLMAAFPRKPLMTTDIEPGMDKNTELPWYFSAKRQEVVTATLKGIPGPATLLYLRAESRFDRGDAAGRRESLEGATQLAPELAPAQLMLAVLYEREGDFTRAKPRYEAVLKVQPRNVVALNNLAYGLAVHEKAFANALEIARRAEALAPNDPMVVDTLAWVEHLSGQSPQAARRYQAIVSRPNLTGEVHLHAAIVFAAVGDLKAAELRLREALKVDPSLEKSDEVLRLRKSLSSR